MEPTKKYSPMPVRPAGSSTVDSKDWMANTYTELLQIKGKMLGKDNEIKVLTDKVSLLEKENEELKAKTESIKQVEELEKQLEEN